jgi:hypothetical protein
MVTRPAAVLVVSRGSEYLLGLDELLIALDGYQLIVIRRAGHPNPYKRSKAITSILVNDRG